MSEFYDFTSDVVQKEFTRLKSIFTFDANRKSNKKNVNWFLNPIIQTKDQKN
jgi:hypothetical protein